MTIEECFAEFTRKGRKCIEVEVFVRRFREHRFTEAQVVAFFETLCEAGRLKPALRVKDPDGVIIGPAYDKREDIPYTVPNRFESYYYPIEACDIFACYQVIK